MDYQVGQIKTEPQESEEYLHQFETNLEQSQNNEVFLNPIPSLNLKQCEKRGFICKSMNQITEHISNSHQSTSLSNITNDDDYNTLLDGDKIIKTETKVLDLNSYEVTVSSVEENIIYLKSEPIHQSTQPNENESHLIFNPKDEIAEPDGNTNPTKYYPSQEFNFDPLSDKNDCTICKKSFLTAEYLQIHYETSLHKNVESVLKRNGLPDSAIESHARGNLYECDRCLKQFRQRSNFIIHLRRHTGERPFGCNLCGKGFVTNYLLNQHKLIHSRAKLYKCNQCPNQFRQKSGLTLHNMYLHTRKKTV